MKKPHLIRPWHSIFRTLLTGQIKKNKKVISKFFLFNEDIRRSNKNKGIREADDGGGEDVRVLTSSNSDGDEDGGNDDDNRDSSDTDDDNNEGNNGVDRATYIFKGHMQGWVWH